MTNGTENINRSIRTTKKNHIYIIMRREGKAWRRVDATLFVKRDEARQCSRELNALQPVRNGKRVQRYKVGKMIVAQNAR